MIKLFTISVSAFFVVLAHAQDVSYSRNSIKTGVSFAANEGDVEEGLGVLLAVGYQKSYLNERLRVNRYIMAGGFQSIIITDTEDEYYRITTAGLDESYDAFKVGSFSIYINAGVFGDYSRGLLGTGGGKEQINQQSEYFHKLYAGGNFGAGLRINSKNSKVAYDFSPFNYYIGTRGFLTGAIRFGIEFKLKKLKR